MLGFLVGAVLYGMTNQAVFPKIAEIAKIGNVVIPDLWNLSPYLTVLLFGLISLLLFYAIDRANLHRKEKESQTGGSSD